MSNNFKEMKMRIKNEDQCIAVQKHLFSLGYEWIDGGKTVLYADDAVFLYTTSYGRISYNEGYEEQDFISDPRQEVEVKYTIELVPVSQLVVLHGEEYTVSEQTLNQIKQLLSETKS